MIQFSDYKEALKNNKTIVINPTSASYVAYFLHDKGAVECMKSLKVKFSEEVEEFKIV